MSKKGSLWLIFDRYFPFWKQAIFIPLSFSPKQNFIYTQKGSFYHLHVLTFVHLMPLIVFDLDRGCCPYSSPNDTPSCPQFKLTNPFQGRCTLAVSAIWAGEGIHYHLGIRLFA